MATVRPFKAFRPDVQYAQEVAALPYDVMTSAEAREMVQSNPHSFLHVDRAEIDLDPSIDPYDPAVYQKAKENLERMTAEGILVQDLKPMFYIYRLTMDERSQTGLVACTAIDEYLDGIIKKHELTREDKEQDRIRHVDACNANTGPIFLTYRAQDRIDQLIEGWIQKHRPIYDFTAEDGVRHTVWTVDQEEVIESIAKAFERTPSLYIADGHHRNASAVQIGLARRKSNPHYHGEEEFNFYLSVSFPDNQLYIMDYNRLVKDLNGLEKEVFLEKVQEKFDIEVCANGKPQTPRTFGMYLEGQWRVLKAKSAYVPEDPVAGLDVSILQNELLNPILGVKDPRKDKRIDFVGGMRGLKELTRRVDSGEMKVAFAVYPTSMRELLAVADAGKIMPPKSTWFEPKLRSGLFIHSLA